MQRTKELITRQFNGELSAQEQLELAAMLEKSAEARTLLAAHIRLEADLIDLGLTASLSDDGSLDLDQHSLAAASTTPKNTASISKSASQQFRWLFAAAIVMTIAGLLFVSKPWQEDSTNQQDQTVVAQVARLVDVSWDQHDALNVGDAIKTGLFEIKSGLAEIEFLNGATLIVEGPASLDIESAERTFVRHGKLRSIVPPEAFGFTVESSNVKVVDLGTEFGIEIDPDGTSEVHVFDGEVEMYETRNASLSKRLLSAGQAVQIAEGLQRDIPADSDAFIDALALHERANVYIEDLQLELKDLARKRTSQIESILRRQFALKNSQQLLTLKKESNQAQQAWKQATSEHARVRQHLRKKQELLAKIDALAKSKLAKKPKGSQLLKRLAKVELEHAELKKQIADLEKGKSRQKRKLNKRLRTVQQDRLRLKKRFRTERSKLRRTDTDIRSVVNMIENEKRKLERLYADTNLGELKRRADQKRKSFLSLQSRLFRDDQELQKLRDHERVAGRKIRDIRRRIHQANKLDGLTNMVDHQESNALDSI